MKFLFQLTLVIFSILLSQVCVAVEADPASIEEARTLYKQGQAAYDLGDYEHAIKFFSHSYELSNAPGLLYNIAQSYRLMGDCRLALEEYRHFLRLAPSSGHKSEAESFVAELEKSCPPQPDPTKAQESATPLPAPLPAISSSIPVLDTRTVVQKKSPYRWVRAPALATGLILGVTSYAFHRENASDYRAWTKENDHLARGTGPGESREAFQERQDQNDALLQHIEGRDTLVIGLALGATAMILTAAVTSLLEN